MTEYKCFTVEDLIADISQNLEFIDLNEETPKIPEELYNKRVFIKVQLEEKDYEGYLCGNYCPEFLFINKEKYNDNYVKDLAPIVSVCILNTRDYSDLDYLSYGLKSDVNFYLRNLFKDNYLVLRLYVSSTIGRGVRCYHLNSYNYNNIRNGNHYGCVDLSFFVVYKVLFLGQVYTLNNFTWSSFNRTKANLDKFNAENEYSIFQCTTDLIRKEFA